MNFTGEVAILDFFWSSRNKNELIIPKTNPNLIIAMNWSFILYKKNFQMASMQEKKCGPNIPTSPKAIELGSMAGSHYHRQVVDPGAIWPIGMGPHISMAL